MYITNQALGVTRTIVNQVNGAYKGFVDSPAGCSFHSLAATQRDISPTPLCGLSACWYNRSMTAIVHPANVS